MTRLAWPVRHAGQREDRGTPTFPLQPTAFPLQSCGETQKMSYLIPEHHFHKLPKPCMHTLHTHWAKWLAWALSVSTSSRDRIEASGLSDSHLKGDRQTVKDRDMEGMGGRRERAGTILGTKDLQIWISNSWRRLRWSRVAGGRQDYPSRGTSGSLRRLFLLSNFPPFFLPTSFRLYFSIAKWLIHFGHSPNICLMHFSPNQSILGKMTGHSILQVCCGGNTGWCWHSTLVRT